MSSVPITLTPIGYVRSSINQRSQAPLQGWEGSPLAAIEVAATCVAALDGLKTGDRIWVITWLHQSQRDTLRVHPRGDLRHPLTGVFATRSPDRPNPLGLHLATILALDGNRVDVADLEAIDGTPVLDIKPMIEGL
jgi:tRNA-Thr(GGU) m(6)t(6)A37 methyltransferase TsaA